MMKLSNDKDEEQKQSGIDRSEMMVNKLEDADLKKSENEFEIEHSGDNIEIPELLNSDDVKENLGDQSNRMNLVDVDVDKDKPDFEDIVAKQDPHEDFALGPKMVKQSSNPYSVDSDHMPGVVAPDTNPADSVHVLKPADPQSKLK